MRPRHIKLLVFGPAVATLGLYPLFDAAGKGVAVAATVAVLALVVIVFLAAAVLILRAPRDQRAEEFLQSRGNGLLVILFAAVPVPVAAHPWGVATALVGFGVLFASQALVHVAIVVVGIRHGRSRTTTPR